MIRVPLTQPDWAEHLRALTRHACPCGSGGAMACDEDCPGDTRDPSVVDAVVALIKAMQKAQGA